MDLLNSAERILLVGEGNFSFAFALGQKLSNWSSLFASCYEGEVSVKGDNEVKERLNKLTDLGATVLFEVDATDLQSCPSINLMLFDVVLFNFPHIKGKNNMKKNRDLLKGFFKSASKSLSSDGHILVNLCNGQGGTPVDNPQREWQNSWQVVSMAAHGDLILTQTEKFEPTVWSCYENTGFRGRNQRFNAEGAIVHVFVKSIPIPFSSESPSPSDWTEYQLHRNLVHDEHHPFHLVKCRLKSQFDLLRNQQITTANNTPKVDELVLANETVSLEPDKSNSSADFTNDKNIEGFCIDQRTNFFIIRENVCDKEATKCVADPINQVHQIQQCIHCVLHQQTKQNDDSSSCVIQHVHQSLIKPDSYPIMHYFMISNRGLSNGNPDFDNFVRNILQPFLSKNETLWVKQHNDPNTKTEINFGSGLESICNLCKVCESFVSIECVSSIEISKEHQNYCIGKIYQLWNNTTRCDTNCIVISLEYLLMMSLDIQDVRLLWTEDKTLWQRFNSVMRNQSVSHSNDDSKKHEHKYFISLHPPKYFHTVSFWMPSDGKEFDLLKFYGLIRQVSFDSVKIVEEVGTFWDDFGHVSNQCFRLVYQSCDRALTKEMAIHMQLELRKQMEKELNVKMR